MTSSDIQRLIQQGEFPVDCPNPELVETHISWVVLCNQFVYKIKKPMQYAFLDFSTLDKRQYYCEREVKLNQRLTADMYLDVVPIREHDGCLTVDGALGVVQDYAVRMRRLNRQKQMDVLLGLNQVTKNDIIHLADHMALFHSKADIVRNVDPMDVRSRFNALADESGYLNSALGAPAGERIRKAIVLSDRFLDQHKRLLFSRLEQGYYRDGHGDLHARKRFSAPSTGGI
jgi:uncharacterized protein